MEINLAFRKIFFNSYSQLGEDLVINKILRGKKNFFYVDVGANDPDRFSNTKYYYLRGGHGINIEPNVINFKKFVKSRKRDINLNIGISDKNNTLKFYEFKPSTLSTFSKKDSDENIKNGYDLIGCEDILVMKLSDVFDKYLKGNSIDFLSVDTEGFDIKVLMSNDWKKYRPSVICVENTHINDSLIEKYLTSAGYIKKFSNKINSIYVCE